MPIIFNQVNNEFHLFNENISYIIALHENGKLIQRYYGKRLSHQEDFSYLLQFPNESVGNAVFLKNEDSFSTMSRYMQEYPESNGSDYREPAFLFEYSDGSRYTDLRYSSHEIICGKKRLDNLPSSFTNDKSEAWTLLITMKDSILNTEVIMRYSIFEDVSVIVRSCKIKNVSDSDMLIHRVLSMSLDLPDMNYEMISLYGDWIKERHVERRRIRYGKQGINSKKGVSSSWHNPFLALARPETLENSGEVYGFNLIYSGNFLAEVEVDPFDVTRVILGINDFDFKWTLSSNEEFQTPEVVMVYSDKGLNGMSLRFHRFYENNLISSNKKNELRPVLINNWEATYFNFNEEKLLNIARVAAKAGIELFVLDDGWFKGRNDDTSSLGDWVVDENKLPNGIKFLADEIRKLGLEFGIWVEPEMISMNSDLYRNNSEWIIRNNNREPLQGRYQYILDIGRADVRDYLFESISKILKDSNASYVKWDMNRTFSNISSLAVPSNRQMEVCHKYVLGLYELMQRFINEFPNILFESCASGGNRFDPGMLYYMPQVWTSDNTDALERQYIQYGTSIVYPLSTMSAHVSAAPNHQMGRMTPIQTRYCVAAFGVLGYELDLTLLSEEEIQIIKNQIKHYKEYRKLLQRGSFYRLISPFEGNYTAWMSVSNDKSEAMIGYYKKLTKSNPGFKRIKLTGLDEKAFYKIIPQDKISFAKAHKNGEMIVSGSLLMNAGLMTEPEYLGTAATQNTILFGDFGSQMIYLKKVNK